MTPDEIARGLTDAQRAAFKWLKEHGGDACFDKHGVAFAMGETAETTRTVWNALEKAGLICVALNEIDKHACATLRNNRPNWNVLEGDIKDFIFSQY